MNQAVDDQRLSKEAMLGKIGIVDADLLDKGTRFPNLAAMKIAGYWKNQGSDVQLCLAANDAEDCDRLFVSKVFTKTKIPEWLRRFDDRCEFGGTGFSLFKAEQLPSAVEHSKPFYDLYAPFVESFGAKKPHWMELYTKASIGFTSRGCFRRCSFCVNRNKTCSEKWSPVKEFLDKSRPHIVLLDDNVFACKDWREIFDELDATGKSFVYKQGVDIRLMTHDKAKALAKSKNYGDLYFAFDNPADEKEFRFGAKRFRAYCDKAARAFLLCGYHYNGVEELNSLFKRLDAVSDYGILQYIMRHENYLNDKYRALYIDLARWTNQAWFFKKIPFSVFCELHGSKKSKELVKSNELKQFVPHFEKMFWQQ